MSLDVYYKLLTRLECLLSPERHQWLSSALEQIAGSNDLVNDMLNLSAIARRIVGHDFIDADATPLPLTSELHTRHWTTADACRALFILKAVQTDAPQALNLIQCYFQQGDETEIAAIVRILILLPEGDKLKFYAREVGRTNSKPLFAALAQYNPYPAAYYTDHEFNQLVLKALFMGIAIEPVVGLSRRANPELSQMCEDYINERAAAQRSIPPDIWLALAPYASLTGEDLLARQLSIDALPDRYYAVKALLQPPVSAQRQRLLNEHLQTEQESSIRALFAAH